MLVQFLLLYSNRKRFVHHESVTISLFIYGAELKILSEKNEPHKKPNSWSTVGVCVCVSSFFLSRYPQFINKSCKCDKITIVYMKKKKTNPDSFVSIVAKPAPLRNCTLRPYLTSTYAITMNSTNLTSSVPHSNANYNSQQQLNGPKELNYINTEYQKDRIAAVSTASKKPSKSTDTVMPNMGKFNKKSSPTNGNGYDGGSASGIGIATVTSGREFNTKSRRMAKSYNPDNHKKSHSPRTKDESLDVLVGDDNEFNYAAEIDEDDDDGGDEDVSDRLMRPTSSFSTVKSNLSYMTSRMEHQRNAKHHHFHSNVKRNPKTWSKGSNGHKTNGDDTVNDMSYARASNNGATAAAAASASFPTGSQQEDVANVPNPLSSSSRLFSTSTIKSMITGSNETASTGNDRSRTRDEGFTRKNKNRNHFDSHENYNNLEMKSDAGLHKPNIAYLKSAVTAATSSSVSAVSSEPKSMQSPINNHHLNSNHVIVDSYESPPTTMELECVAGYDGGLPQSFVLEAYDSRTKKLRLNITSAFSDIPLFRIDLAGMLHL